jgi:polysaccharide biosynthesis protein PelD
MLAGNNLFTPTTAEGRWWQTILETFIITVIALACGFAVKSTDPLLNNSGFPWLLFLPVLLSLRHGMFYGLTSNTITIVIFNQYLQTNYLVSYFVGSSLMIILCGQFSISYIIASRRNKEMLDYQETKLNTLSHAYYLSKLSHQQLEQNLITKPTTLRQAIYSIRFLLDESKNKLTKEVANSLLATCSGYCGITQASLYLANDEYFIENQPISTIGKSFELDLNDPLVEKTIGDENCHYTTPREIISNRKTNYLAVIPCHSSNNTVYAYLIIKSIPFILLNDENLESLLIMLTYFADTLDLNKAASPILKIIPECPLPLANEITKLSRLYKQLKLSSYLAGIYLTPDTNTEYLKEVYQKTKRGIDQTWTFQKHDQLIHLCLMPFSKPATVSAYLRRTSDWLKQDFGIDPNHSPNYTRERLITSENPSEQIKKMIAYAK